MIADSRDDGGLNAHGVGPLWWGGEWWSSLVYAITYGMRQPRIIWGDTLWITLASALPPSAHSSATFRWKHFNILAPTLALPPNLRQIAEDFFNGLNRESATMHSRKCMDGLGNFHGSASAIPWFSFFTSIHQLENPVF